MTEIDVEIGVEHFADYVRSRVLAASLIETHDAVAAAVLAELESGHYYIILVNRQIALSLRQCALVEAFRHGHRTNIKLCRFIHNAAFFGFTIADGPEIEDDWHVFSALNFAEDHPARDMQDTFFIQRSPDVLLRTHTSSVQTRVMTTQHPPIRIICPGRVYRNEAISARAHCFFHQVEALYIDKNVSFADLKQTLLYFARELFGADTRIRLRPSYFPFTEPSAEMDISCHLCGGKGCAFCKQTGWVEILGCGMVDSKVYSGFALGMGVERITNLKYRVKDLRMFSENDIRFLDEFKAVH